jgi:chromate transporter
MVPEAGMNVFMLYLLLLKATITSFSGLASLPVLRADLVVKYKVLSDRQLTAAVAAGRMGPGPAGNYVVSAGYQVAGTPGAVAGWLAMITPAFLIIPIIRFLGARAEHPRAKSAVRAVVLATCGLLLSSSVPLGRDAITGVLPASVAAGSFLLTFFTRIDTLWIMLAAACAGLFAYYIG